MGSSQGDVMGTKLRFHDVGLELTSMPEIAFTSDGSMVLGFSGFTGTITFRSLKPAAAANAPSPLAASSSSPSPASAQGASPSPGEVAIPSPGTAVQQQPPSQLATPSNSSTTDSPTAAPLQQQQQQQSVSSLGGSKRRVGSLSSIESSVDQSRDGDDADKENHQQHQEQEDAAASSTGGKKKKKAARKRHTDSPSSAGGGSSVSPGLKDEEQREGVSPAPITTRQSVVVSPPLLSASRPLPGASSEPAGRWGHSATLLLGGPGPRMLVYGGVGDDDTVTLSDVFVFEMDDHGGAGGGRWVKPINCEDQKRAWHTATYLPHKNLLIAFGGECVASVGGGGRVAGQSEVVEEVRALDTEIFLWYPPSISGKPPAPRSGHSASVVGDDVIFFGGSRGRKWATNVVVLDTDRWQWRVPAIAGDAPEGRSYHSAVVVGGSDVVIFGGNNGAKCFSRVHVLRTSSSSSGGGKMEWFHPEVVGQAPSARTGQCAVLLGDGKTILVHGGWDPQDETRPETLCFRDAFLLDTASWEWLPAPAHVEQRLGYLTGHTAVWVPERHAVLVFGGQDDKGARSDRATLLEMPQQYCQPAETTRP